MKMRIKFSLITILLVITLLLTLTMCSIPGKGVAESTPDWSVERDNDYMVYSAEVEAEPVTILKRDNPMTPRNEKQIVSGFNGARGDVVAGNLSSLSKPAPNRKQIFNGQLDIEVEDTDAKRKEIEKLTTDNGGYIEQSYQNLLVIRIPVEKYFDVFSTLQTYGKILSISETTIDITAQFNDTTALLKTAEKTRERLYRLLRQSTDPEERAKILKEIGRLTEEIELIRQRLTLMQNKASFSQISVTLTPRMAGDFSRQGIPFPWIKQLNPLHPLSDKLKAKLKVEPGQEWAVFDQTDFFYAENAAGSVIRVSSVKNEPKGDSAYWQKAVRYHLKDFYQTAETGELKIGEETFLTVQFISKDRDPYLYRIGMLAKGKWIQVIEIFSPDSETDFSAVYKALEEGAIK